MHTNYILFVIHFDTTCAVQVQSLHHQLIINQLHVKAVQQRHSPNWTRMHLKNWWVF